PAQQFRRRMRGRKLGSGTTRIWYDAAVTVRASRALSGRRQAALAARQLRAAKVGAIATSTGRLPRGDSRADRHRDAGGAAGGDCIGGTAEAYRLAALEPNHSAAAARQLDHLSDLVLVAGRTMTGSADQYLSRLPPREFEDVRRDQSIKQDDVGRLQRAHRPQGQQIGI